MVKCQLAINNMKFGGERMQRMNHQASFSVQLTNILQYKEKFEYIKDVIWSINRRRSDNKKDKQWSTEHYTNNSRLSNTNRHGLGRSARVAYSCFNYVSWCATLQKHPVMSYLVISNEREQDCDYDKPNSCRGNLWQTFLNG